MMRRKRIEGLRVFNDQSGTWSATALAAITATFDPEQHRIFILGVEFIFDGQDDDEATLRGKLKGDDATPTLLRIPMTAYEELIHEGNITPAV